MNLAVLGIGPRITALPIAHGSGDFAWQVRQVMLGSSFDCLAVPLPPSFARHVEQAILDLPTPSVVAQREWDYLGSANESGQPAASYVPIDPCQGVIAAIRAAMEDRIPRRFIDLETDHFEPYSVPIPDAYALKKVPLDQFAAALLPFLPRPNSAQWRARIDTMAWRLKELSVDFRNILLVCHLLDWPWIRLAFERAETSPAEDHAVGSTARYQLDPKTLYFLLGELPLVTGMYERARAELSADAHLSIDGIKELLILARNDYLREHGRRARRITPQLLQQCMKYIRNLTLIDHLLTPQLSRIITATKQIAGDTYALHVLEMAKHYPYARELDLPQLRMGIDRAALPDGDVWTMKSRLPGPPVRWSRIQLVPRPDRSQRQQWRQRWNPLAQCSWPPDDELIEHFRAAVFDRARQVMGADLARSEKFTTSLKDGIDMRDTLRHWYENKIYVKVLPPNRGKLDCAVMLFDSPADPRDYPWRSTWFAEHQQESTLAFFATNYQDQPVGPGICQATYGGTMMIFPPVAIPDIWIDPRLDFATTLEERLLAAACLHSDCPQIALLSSFPPGPGWRRLAKRFRKTWVHIPLGRFSDGTVQQLRLLHVLNGKQVRSYAAHFIRRA